MARPFRFTPPDLAAGSVLRDRVQVVLAGRFERRVTCIVGGAGFGKTTAVVQAFEENRLAPLGADLWLACEPDDGDPWHFARSLAIAADLDDVASPPDVVEMLIERVGARSPGALCLVLDDVQFLADGASVEVLDGLIDALPSNGHLLLCGRRLPEIAITRLELIGEAVVVGESDLAFEGPEIAELLGAEVAAEGGDFGGWPALVRLAGSGRARSFVDEEVLRSLDASELEVVRSLAILGEASTETLRALVGSSAEACLEALPLVHRRGDRWAAHDLWAELLAPIDPIVVEQTRRAASRSILDGGDAIGAVDVLLPLPARVVDVDDVELGAALRDVVIRADRIDPSILRRWAERWRHDEDDPGAEQPAILLLHGLLSRLDNPGGDRCQVLLRAAVEQFQQCGDDLAAVSALSALVYSYHVRRDVAGLLWAFGELQRFADAGVAAAEPFPLLGRALVATSSASPADVIVNTEQLLEMPLSRELRAMCLWLHATALGNLGRPSLDAAAECYDIGLPVPGMAMIQSGARWRSGMIRDMLASPTQPLDGERDRFLTATWESCLYAALGDIPIAEERLDVVRGSVAHESQWQTAGSVLLPTMAVYLSAGRLDDASAAVHEFLAATPREDQGRFYRWIGIGAIYLLAPGERDWYHDFVASNEIGPLYRRDLDLVAALVAVEERGDESVVRDLAFPATAGELMPSVGMRHGATLLAAAVGIGRDDVGSLLDDLADLVGERVRDRWRDLVDHPVPMVADGARQIIESLPVPPPAPVSLSVLGATLLHQGEAEVDHPDWRRERVRALLTFLVLHRDATREQVMAALWPEAEEAAARRSLRSTLSMLHDVVELTRRSGDAPFFVRTSGQRMSLRLASVAVDHGSAAPSDGLFVDVVRFERLIDEGDELERRGTPSRSVEPYVAALSLYRGDLLPDCYDDWAVFERDRLRSRVVAAGVRAAELLAATGRARRAAETATRVLTIEPWSEPAHRALIAAHLESDDVAAARRSLETCERVLADLGGPMDDETLQLTRRLARR